MSTFKSSPKYSESEVTEILLKNTLLMMEERGRFEKKNHKKNLKNLYDQIKDDLLFTLKKDKFKLGIRIVKYKVTSITKVEGIDQFLKDDTYNIRIIVFKDMNQKTFKQLIAYENTQPFKEQELMFNIVEHDYVDKHEVLSIEERTKFIKSYQTTRDNLPKLNLYGPIARYYNLQVGDVVRIYRSNPLSGVGIQYRVVIRNPVQDLFS